MSNKHTQREDNIRGRERFSDNKAKFNQDFKRLQRELKYGSSLGADEFEEDETEPDGSDD